ncbi:MAG TPA: hypothetical protein VIE63_11625, partial [Ramlibacter sp.]
MKVVGSAKDLNPESLIEERRIEIFSGPLGPAEANHIALAQAACLQKRSKMSLPRCPAAAETRPMGGQIRIGVSGWRY